MVQMRIGRGFVCLFCVSHAMGRSWRLRQFLGSSWATAHILLTGFFGRICDVLGVRFLCLVCLEVPEPLRHAC